MNEAAVSNQISPKIKFNTSLEALRGFAALFVVINHLQVLNKVFNAPYLPKLLIEFSPNGHLCVLIFFVLSGFVIFESHRENLTSGTIVLYLKKRLIRIYPIYILAMILTLLVSTQHYSIDRIAGNFAIMQDLLVPPFVENGPAWSLHFEVLYYLLFIPVSYFRFNPLVILMACIIIALANYFTYPNPDTAIISAYLFGFSFWMAGLCIAKYAKQKTGETHWQAILGTLFLSLAIDQLLAKTGLAYLPDQLSSYLFHKHLLYPPIESSKILIGYKDLVYLPYCIYFVLSFSGKSFKYQNIYFMFLQLPLIFALVLAAREFFVLGNHQHILTFLIAVIYYAMSLFLYYTDFTVLQTAAKKVVAAGSWLGGISYAMYIIHMPFIYLAGRIPFLNGQLPVYLLKVIVFFTMVISLSYLLEKKMQPWIKRKFLPAAIKPVV
jgi:peptidoglycan/LPS O-acetylase OafA/YrhL